VVLNLIGRQIAFDPGRRRPDVRDCEVRAPASRTEVEWKDWLHAWGDCQTAMLQEELFKSRIQGRRFLIHISHVSISWFGVAQAVPWLLDSGSALPTCSSLALERRLQSVWSAHQFILTSHLTYLTCFVLNP